VSEITLHAKIRSNLGRSSSNSIRRAGNVPGIFYLHNETNIPIEVRSLDLRPLVYTAETHIVNLKLEDGSERQCIVRDVQFDPITDKVVHFDLMGLVKGEKIKMEIPVVLEGASVGVREGGVLNHILHKIELECLPSKLPEHIVVDISNLHIGDIVTVGDLNLSDVDFLIDAELPVVMIVHARGEETEAGEVSEGEEMLEPEVISKGKSDKEED